MTALILYICDICNICAAFLSCFMFFLRFMGIWQWSMTYPGFILILVGNVYGSFLLYRTKTHIVAHVLKMFDSQPGVQQTKRDRLEMRLNSRLLFSDLAEFSFGILGRFLIDICLVFLQMGWLTFSAPIVATSLAMYFENSSFLYENSTLENSDTLLFMAPTEGAFATAMLILLCLYCTTTLFQTVRHSCVLSAMTLMSFVGVLTVIIETIAVKGIKPTAPNDTIEVFGQQAILYLDDHRLSSVQIVITLFTVEASMRGTRRAFVPTLLVCAGLTLLVGCSFVYMIGRDGYGILVAVDGRSCVHLFMIVSAVAIFPLQNIPLYHVIERRVLNRCTCCKEEADDLQPLMIDHPRGIFDASPQDSFMMKMRQEDFDSLDSDEIANDLLVKVKWPCRFAMRFGIVVFEMLLAYLLYSVRSILRAFTFLCLLSSRFLAIIFPAAMFLKLQWFSSHALLKIINIVVIIFGITEVCFGTYFLMKNINKI